MSGEIARTPTNLLWLNTELDSSETSELLRFVGRSIGFLQDGGDHPALYEDFTYHHKVAGKDGLARTILDVRALAAEFPVENQDTSLVVWRAKIHLDEYLGAFKRSPKPASLYRRTYVRVDSRADDPFFITRSHELKRRSKHKFSRPMYRPERTVLAQHENFSRSRLQRRDEFVIRSALGSLVDFAFSVPDISEA